MYYTLNETDNKKIIGSLFPQCIGLVKGYDESASNSIFNFAQHKGKQVYYLPNLDGIKLDSNANLTDIVSCGLGPGNDTIVNGRGLEILFKCERSEMQVFECFLYKKGQRFHYHWIHYIYNLEQAINFTKSVFNHPDFKLESKYNNIQSYNEFCELYENEDKYGLIKSKKIVLNCQPLDFFVIGRANQKKYVSKRLVEKLISEKINGLEIEESDDIEFE